MPRSKQFVEYMLVQNSHRRRDSERLGGSEGRGAVAAVTLLTYRGSGPAAGEHKLSQLKLSQIQVEPEFVKLSGSRGSESEHSLDFIWNLGTP